MDYHGACRRREAFCEALFLHAIVTRVRPRTSKGMTDLLLTHFKNLIGSDASKKHMKQLLAGSLRN